MRKLTNNFSSEFLFKNSKDYKIKTAVVGMGKIGKACACQIKKSPDFELAGIFSRRQIKGTISLKNICEYKDRIDVVLVCVGSSDDAPKIVPVLAKHFSTVDSFDIHAKLSDYIESISKAKKETNSKTVSIVATGWDPGLLSVMRLYLSAAMPNSAMQTFWGNGVSMGHTNAIKQIANVREAIQFTIPKPAAIAAAKNGNCVPDTAKHKRLCFVVPSCENPTQETLSQITDKIKNIPNYFKGQETEVKFITQQQFNKKYKNRTEHAGQIICTNSLSAAHFKLKLKNNARFTAQIMLAYAVANFILQKEGLSGIFTVADIAPKYLFNEPQINLI